MHWSVRDTGIASAKANMQQDRDWLNILDTLDAPILHFYDWQGDSATYGHFVKPETYLDLSAASRLGLSLAKRPTGGGIVFHIWDLAFSVLIPSSHELFSENTLENYNLVNSAVLRGVTSFLKDRPQLELIYEDALSLDASCSRFCMARPTKYDVVLNGKKIAGAAQRKTKKGLLHQGTIALKMPSMDYLRSILLPGTQVLDAMMASTYPLIAQDADITEARNQLKIHLQHAITQGIGTCPTK